MIVTVARGSADSRCATSSRHALSTFVSRDRLRGKPPARHDTASALGGGATAAIATEQSEAAVWPWSSDTRTVIVAFAGGVAPVKSKAAVDAVPTTRPALALH